MQGGGGHGDAAVWVIPRIATRHHNAKRHCASFQHSVVLQQHPGRGWSLSVEVVEEFLDLLEDGFLRGATSFVHQVGLEVLGVEVEEGLLGECVEYRLGLLVGYRL